jgi:hypothetical protein
MTGAGASRPSQVSCPQCGTLVERGKHALCPECGYPFNWAEPAPPDTGQQDAGMAHTPDETSETTRPPPPSPPPPASTGPPPRPPNETVQVPMVTCPVCQTENPRTRTFCQHCGAQLGAPAPPAHPPAATPRRLRSRLPRSGRGWLVVLAAIVLPIATYAATVQLLSREPPVATTPGTTVAATSAPTRPQARCPGGFRRPEVGTALRLAPLAAIRASMGWSDLFVVKEMRTWRESDGLRRWYVKAQQQGDPSRRGRWLVEQQQDGQRLVLASASFETKGYAVGDWRVADGQKLPAGVAGCLAGT